MCASCRSVFSMLCANLPTRSGIGVDLFLVVCLGGGGDVCNHAFAVPVSSVSLIAPDCHVQEPCTNRRTSAAKGSEKTATLSHT